jgi:hypothetical protein
MSPESQWTVLVFLNAKNNLEPFAFPNMLQMAQVGSTPDVNIVVEMGRPKHHFSNAYGRWSKTLRFHVQRGTEPREQDALQDLGDTDMGDARSLIDFVAWGRKAFPARRTMLVIWNHGQGWRAPEETGAPVARPPHAGHRYVSNDDDTGNKLYNRAIQDALTTHLAGAKLDVIAFDACLMAMAETGYALRDVAQVMVASEELEPGTGWNYVRWLEPLVAARGQVDATGLGKLLVDAMKAEYGDGDATTLSAVRLDHSAALATAISRFADAARPLLNAPNRAAFRTARAACESYAPGYGIHSIDLGRYMEQIVKSGLPPEVRDRAADVRAAIERAVIASYASKSRRGDWGSNGIAIYYPASGAAYAGDPDGDGYRADNQEFPVEFVQRESWAEFLRAYWKLVP